MTDVVHVVGLQGVGKSMLVESMALRESARGRATGHLIEAFGMSRAAALAMFPGVDVLYVEHLRREDVKAMPGEVVIVVERVAHATCA